MGLKFLRNAVDQVNDQIVDRTGDADQIAPNAGAFLHDWITTRLPEAVIGLATKVAGREDGSAWIAKEALKAGQDPHIGAFIK